MGTIRVQDLRWPSMLGGGGARRLLLAFIRVIRAIWVIRVSRVGLLRLLGLLGLLRL
jgi:hypothetical protein